MYRQLGVPVYPRRWFEAILDRFPDNASVTVVTMAGQPVAAGVVIAYRDSAEIAWAASVREADRLGANMYLYWSLAI
ncbi:MAG: GNAT family N-acetyltransferase, partial [Woeseiaceae bacterium]|nr:GNAT family N-acetyltransferase [Woeseiaceae bacterium]